MEHTLVGSNKILEMAALKKYTKYKFQGEKN